MAIDLSHARFALWGTHAATPRSDAGRPVKRHASPRMPPVARRLKEPTQWA